MIPRGSQAGGGTLEDLLQQFSQTLEEANRELLDEVRGELRELHARVGALEGELRIARLEIETLRRAPAGTDPAPPAPVAAAEPAPDSAPAEEQPPARSAEAERMTDELRQRHKDIWQLLSAGEPPAEVAKRTNRPQGEVELIMRLMRQRGTTAPGTGR